MQGDNAMLRLTIALVLFFCLTDVASANMGAAHLKQYCETKDSPYQLTCFGYIQGILDTLNFHESVFQKTQLGAGMITCMPPEVPEKVIQGIVMRYLDDHPEQLKYSAITEVESALTEAYPCQQKSN